MAAESGLRMATRAGIRLSAVPIACIASGIPWPRIAELPQRAMTPMISPPITGTAIPQTPRVEKFGAESAVEMML